MVKKYRIGNPIKTDAVIVDVPIIEGILPEWQVSEADRSLTYEMTDEAVVYGLGETLRGMNKRGWEYTSYNADDPHHMEDKRSLYGAQNFLIIDENHKKRGFFFDTPGRVTFDVGYTKMNKLTVRFEDFDCDIYEVYGDTKIDIVRAFRQLIGKSYVPPKWAFGYGQSRWSYRNEDEIRALVDGYEEAGIPMDSVYMDIDYMERYKDFTVDESAFPKFAEFVTEMKNRGIHLVPIIDAGVKIEEGYSVYEEGVQKGYFCKKEDGSNLVAAVWPGRVHFPDFLNKEAREWFGNQYQFLLDMGIEGFWNDMNEPAIFYTEDHLQEVFDRIEEYKNMNLDIHSFFEFQSLVRELSNNQEDYERFYHDYDGVKVRHDKVHNLYGFNMTRAAGEAFKRLVPDKKILMFSRSSYIGAHRYGGIWTGDNKSWWSHLLLNLQQMPALNMCGFLYSGADTGGFGGDCTRDLMLRWLGLSIFTPLLRNHAADQTRRQELTALGDTEDFKNIVELRYALLPYIYQEYKKAVDQDTMYFMPLSFVYEEDEQAREIEDQLMVGESVMIAPVYKQNTTGRMVYLPEDMRMIRFRSYSDYDVEKLTAGYHYVKTKLNEVAVYVRSGHKLPLARPARTVDAIDWEQVKYV